MIKTAVILTVYNRKKVTLHGLRSLYRAITVLGEGYAFDIFMTDDGCTDGTGEAVANEFPEIKIIKGDGNLYWSGGMRKAWQAAIDSGISYDYYLWFNDDVVLYDDALLTMFDDLIINIEDAIVAGATQDSQMRMCTYGVRENNILIEPKGHAFLCTGSLNGNFVLVSHNVYLSLGSIDTHYHHAGGDYDYGFRALKNRIPVYLAKKYVGICDQHNKIEKWCDPSVSFIERWKSLRKPNGMPLGVLYYLESTHYGKIQAIYHVITTFLHCCFPAIWSKIKK